MKQNLTMAFYQDSLLIPNSNRSIIIFFNTNKIHKNWISQGILAKYLLIFAKNIHDRKDVRIFLVKNDTEGVQNERIFDIGLCDTLDLAKISLKNVKVHKKHLLHNTTNLTKSDLLNGIYYGRMMIAEAVC